MKRLWLVTLALTLAGCACCTSMPEYPVAMPVAKAAQMTSEGCPRLAARYADAGLVMTDTGTVVGHASLTILLLQSFGHKPPESVPADEVAIKGPPEQEVIEFESFNGPSLIAALRKNPAAFLRQGYSCRDGAVLLATVEAGENDIMGYVTHSATTLWLTKAADGSLIAAQRKADTHMILIVPVWQTKYIWFQFPQQPEQGKGLPQMPQKMPEGTTRP